MNPRASMPTTLSTRGAGSSRPAAASAVDDRREGGVVGEQRGDVLEHDPGSREVGDVDDEAERRAAASGAGPVTSCPAWTGVCLDGC